MVKRLPFKPIPLPVLRYHKSGQKIALTLQKDLFEVLQSIQLIQETLGKRITGPGKVEIT